MTEKNYGGSTSYGVKAKAQNSKQSEAKVKTEKQTSKKAEIDMDKVYTEEEEIEALKEAGKIASQVVAYAKTIVKKDASLLELAEKIESKIIELGAKPAFPVNLSINEIAAHDTPTYDDTRKASGLLKVDIGVHINGYAADTAFSVDLENSEENKALIKSAEEALAEAVKITSKTSTLSQIGSAIENAMKKNKALPIANLSGHSIDRFDLHSGLTIPNIDNQSQTELGIGLFAIEPFATLHTGAGAVRDGPESTIYSIIKEGNVRSPTAREVLAYIVDNYQTLPFCTRWLYKKFSTKALLAIREIERAGLLHSYAKLIERSNTKVAQAEHSILLTDKEKVVTTV